MHNVTGDPQSPGQLVRALAEERGWTQSVLAIVLGIEQSALSRVMADKRAMDAELALLLGDAFTMPPERFLAAQAAHDLAKARAVSPPDPKRAVRAEVFARLPIAEMIERGWLNADIKNMDQVESELLRFFRADSLDSLEVLPHAAKKSDANADITPFQSAWLYRVREIASEMIVPRYSPSAVREAIAKLGELRRVAGDAHHAPKILADAGVRFVVVESLTSAKIDGACLWLNDMSPVIGVTLRHDRIDNFWFVLRHECEHVLRGHGRRRPMIDAELEGERAGAGSAVSEEERVANEAAADFCVPRGEMDRFYSKKSPFFSERDVLGFAATLRVHPGLVVGQLQHRMGRFDRLRAHLAKIRGAVMPSAAVDGWGNAYPLG